MTPQEQRKIRLKNDHTQMKNIRGDMIQWRAIRGEDEFIEEYEVTVKVRSIVSAGPTYHNFFTMKVALPPDYPFKAAPSINMISSPYPFHPNWFTSGKWCYGSWNMEESLGNHILRMVRTLQYDQDITNEHSPANSAANSFYLTNKNRGLFPCDRTQLPDPTKEKFKVQEKKKFSIN